MKEKFEIITRGTAEVVTDAELRELLKREIGATTERLIRALTGRQIR